MSRLEELPDDYGEFSRTAPTPPAVNGTTEHGPTLPPSMVEPKQSGDELVADLKKSPFFMTSLEDAGDEENIELEAIKALIYEGSRGEVASNFRESGNEEARSKKWRDAKELYTKGLAALKAPRNTEDPTGQEEDQKEASTKEVLLVNRALCHLELRTCSLAHYSNDRVFTLPTGNYRSCTLDCMAALSVNPRNVKAHYRMASALLPLKKLSEAASACAAGLAIDSANKSLLNLRHNVEAEQLKQDAKERERQETEERRKKETDTLAIAIKARQIRMRSTGQPPEMKDAVLQLVPDPLSLKSTLTFPVVVLYPLHLQSDFIKAFGEEQTLQGHLDYLLPLPWDKQSEYTAKDVEAYLETVGGGLIKWGKKVELLKVLSGGKVEVVDGLVKVNLVPKSRASEWIESIKQRSAR